MGSQTWNAIRAIRKRAECVSWIPMRRATSDFNYAHCVTYSTIYASREHE